MRRWGRFYGNMQHETWDEGWEIIDGQIQSVLYLLCAYAYSVRIQGSGRVGDNGVYF